nr:MAG TPA: hypothetical protein [Caudoviricetes sp.]
MTRLTASIAPLTLKKPATSPARQVAAPAYN